MLCWCCFYTEMSKSKTQELQNAVIEDCGFKPCKIKCTNLIRLVVWELVPGLIFVMVYRFKVDLQSGKVLIFEESFAPVARIEAIRLFIATLGAQEHDHLPDGCHTAFLNGDLQEEVFCQSTWEGFEDMKTLLPSIVEDKLFMG
ncbi:hypothetical protein Tco_0179589 [Tanacetum coccineum]